MYSFTKKTREKRNRSRSRGKSPWRKNGTYKTNKHKKRYIRGGVIYLDNRISVDFDDIFENTSIKIIQDSSRMFSIVNKDDIQKKCSNFILSFGTGIMLTILEIDKCSIGGNDILKMYDIIAKNIANDTGKSVKLWIMRDASRIMFKDDKGKMGIISLIVLSLLISGATWYGKHGYVEQTLNKDTREMDPNYAKDKKNTVHNLNIIQQNYNDFFIENGLLTSIEIDDIRRLYDMQDNIITVSDFFKHIQDKLKTLDPMDITNAAIYMRAADLIRKIKEKDILKYSDSVIKVIQPE